MIQILKSNDRGHANHGWLDSRFSFSFSDYYDPKRMGFRHLRVINEDYVAGSQGFGMHPHRDMEIITYILEGEIEHKDSMGNGGIIRAGEIQRMSAGTGVHHSEINPSPTDPVHLLQIWIFPNQRGVEPSYEQHTLSKESRLNMLRLVAGPERRPDSAMIHQDAKLFSSILEKDKSVSYRLDVGRSAWLQVARGSVTLNGTEMKAGDGAAIETESALEMKGEAAESEFLLFDLA